MRAAAFPMTIPQISNGVRLGALTLLYLELSLPLQVAHFGPLKPISISSNVHKCASFFEAAALIDL